VTAPLVFVTGASSGIGRALAARFARAGYRLALVARREEPMREWVRSHGLAPDAAGIYAADVSQPDSIIAAAERCIAEQGLPDIVIANAGISVGVDTAEREDLDVLRELFATNVVGVAATFHPFLQRMRARGAGTLVAIASVGAIRGMPGQGGYCASKSAVVTYCESLRGECRGSGVRVVTLLPGYIATPLTARNRYPMPFLMQPDAFAARALRAIEAGRSYRVIPWQMAIVAKLLRVLPNAWFDAAFAGRARKRRRGE
jgi:short-subunit dehydrogenase